MKPSRYFALGFVLLTGLLAAISVRQRPVPHAGDAGIFAPGPSRDSVTVVGVVDPSQLTRGSIIALADDGVDVYILQNRAWLRVGPAGTSGPFGSGAAAGRAAISAAADIAVSDSFVYVLDRGRSAVRVYRKSGAWVEDVPVSADGRSVVLERLVARRNEELIVSALDRPATGESARVLLRKRPERTFRMVARTAASVFYPILPVIPHGSATYAVTTADYDVLQLDSSSLLLIGTRRNAPRIPLSPEAYKSAASYSRMISSRTGRRVDPPPYLPLVAAASESRRNSLFVAVVTDDDNVLIEEIDHIGTPVRTMTARAIPYPVGLSATGVVRLREEPQYTVVERIHFHE